MTVAKSDVGLVLVQFALLLAVVAFIDNALVRLGLVFAVGLLLVQRGLGVQSGGQGAFSDRRQDQLTRDAIQTLLSRIREFYAVCHLVQVQQISPAEAAARTKQIEKDLNGLLAEVVRASRGEPAVAQAEP